MQIFILRANDTLREQKDKFHKNCKEYKGGDIIDVSENLTVRNKFCWKIVRLHLIFLQDASLNLKLINYKN